MSYFKFLEKRGLIEKYLKYTIKGVILATRPEFFTDTYRRSININSPLSSDSFLWDTNPERSEFWNELWKEYINEKTYT